MTLEEVVAQLSAGWAATTVRLGELSAAVHKTYYAELREIAFVLRTIGDVDGQVELVLKMKQAALRRTSRQNVRSEPSARSRIALGAATESKVQ